jgi:hypothetical protein
MRIADWDSGLISAVLHFTMLGKIEKIADIQLEDSTRRKWLRSSRSLALVMDDDGMR